MEKETFDEQKFWNLYDQNLANSTDDSRNALSNMIALCAEPFNLKQPEKRRHKILAWKALKDQNCADNGNDQGYYPIKCGEIIIEELGWDRETFVSRIPCSSFVRSGFPYGDGDFGCKGLFMPLYDVVSLEQDIRKSFDEAKNAAILFIKEQKKIWFAE